MLAGRRGAALAGAGILLALLLIVAAIVIVSGAFDVAADSPDGALTRHLFAFARERSIDVRAEGIEVPKLDKPEMIAEGAEHYSAMCTGCHLAPGLGENEIRPGLNPKPPVLAAFPAEDPAEQFWIVKHGIKMTAMPAWGATHSDAEIWNIVAFLQKLPKLSPAQYRALTAHAHDHQMDMHE
jgi:mono/diheme cytochrome c family protein